MYTMCDLKRRSFLIHVYIYIYISTYICMCTWVHSCIYMHSASLRAQVCISLPITSAANGGAHRRSSPSPAPGENRASTGSADYRWHLVRSRWIHASCSSARCMAPFRSFTSCHGCGVCATSSPSTSSCSRLLLLVCELASWHSGNSQVAILYNTRL